MSAGIFSRANDREFTAFWYKIAKNPQGLKTAKEKLWLFSLFF
jgi:hypothetical protein